MYWKIVKWGVTIVLFAVTALAYVSKEDSKPASNASSNSNSSYRY